MDINAIKAKLDALNKSDQQKDKVDYDKIFWKPDFGKHVIRIVPSKYNPSFPFSELKFHYKVGKYTMPALSNYGKQDPIEEFCKELRSGEYNKDNWSLAGTIEPKTRYFAPIIVRGEEDKGVRLWGFGVTVYKALLTLAEDEEVGDYTDTLNGTDITLTYAKGAQFNETSILPKRSDSPLSQDAKQVELWLKEQPDPLESFTQYDYDFLKKALKLYLNPEAEESKETETKEKPAKTVNKSNIDESLPSTLGTQKADFEFENTTPVKEDPVKSFDELFKE